jgi:hypothetical protein
MNTNKEKKGPPLWAMAAFVILVAVLALIFGNWKIALAASGLITFTLTMCCLTGWEDPEGIGRQRRGSGPEDASHVGGVVLAGVEIHVVGDGERQVHIHLVVPASDRHVEGKVGSTREAVLQMTTELVDYAKENGLWVEVIGEDGTVRDAPSGTKCWPHAVAD